MKTFKKTLFLLLFLFTFIFNTAKNDDTISPHNELDFPIAVYSLN